MSKIRQQPKTSSKPPALTGPEVAHFSMSPVARFSMSLDKSRALAQEQADALWDLQRSTDPVALLGTIRRCQGQLAVLASGEQASGDPSAQAERDLAAENRSLEIFLGGLQTLWHSSQPRRRKPKPRTGKRSRPDPFEPDVELIEQWLQAEPLIRAKTLMGD